MAFLGRRGMRRHLVKRHQYGFDDNGRSSIPRLIFSWKLSALKASVIPEDKLLVTRSISHRWLLDSPRMAFANVLR